MLFLVSWLRWYVALCCVVLWGIRLFFAKYLRHDVSREVVLVTSAASGTGRAIARCFVAKGCRVALWDSSPIVREVERELQAMPSCRGVRSYVVDGAHREMVYDVAEQVERDMGFVTLLVAGAGAEGLRLRSRLALSPTGAMSPARLRRRAAADAADAATVETVEACALATLWTLRAFLPSMIERNSGTVVLLSTNAGFLGCPGHVDYAAAQAATAGIGESLRREAKGRRIRVVTASVPMPRAEDEQWDLPPLGVPASPQATHDAIRRREAYELQRQAAHQRVAIRIVGAVERRQTSVCVSRYPLPVDTLAAAARLLPTAASDAVTSVILRYLA